MVLGWLVWFAISCGVGATLTLVVWVFLGFGFAVCVSVVLNFLFG